MASLTLSERVGALEEEVASLRGALQRLAHSLGESDPFGAAAEALPSAEES